MVLTPRRIEIFKCLVDEFIATAEPVGSITLVSKYNLPYSSATIRNDMVILEELGFIEKPYSSSGRVPSTKGYKFYCEHLLEKRVDNDSKNAITDILHNHSMNIEDAIKQSCDIVSQMTNLTTGILGPDSSSELLEHIKLFQIDDQNAVCVLITSNGHTESRNFQFRDDVSLKDIETCVDILNNRLKGTKVSELYLKLEGLRPLLSQHVKRHELLFNAFASAFVKFASENVYFASKNNIMYQPEFSDIEKLKKLMNILEDEMIWKNVRNNNLELAIKTHSGAEMAWFDDVAVVSNKVKINDNEEAQLMVVGPSRMEYDRIVGLLDFISDEINKMYRR
ncbi:MAG: heat-inducible transcriptional repressor HrcA [Erysipelotrichaceae bacterium]|nr:heat-inducible transcriptional repressor HrcA [Erysipelotrichaceae bacterium]